MENRHSPKIPILFLGLLLPALLTIAAPANGNPIFNDQTESNAIRAVASRKTPSFVHDDYLLSSPSYPSLTPSSLASPSSISHQTPNPLSSRSLKGWTYRFITTNFIIPTRDTAFSTFKDINDTMMQWMNYVAIIDSYAPSWHFTLGYGDLRMKFWSPAPIPWIVVTEILKLYLLLGMMVTTFFSRVYWEYATLAAVTVLFYAMGERPEGVIPV